MAKNYYLTRMGLYFRLDTGWGFAPFGDAVVWWRWQRMMERTREVWHRNGV